jgi:hypothetical protein
MDEISVFVPSFSSLVGVVDANVRDGMSTASTANVVGGKKANAKSWKSDIGTSNGDVDTNCCEFSGVGADTETENRVSTVPSSGM